MTEKRTEISELGEFGLIDRLKDSVTTYNDSTLTGIGDDAAVIDGGDQATLLATDQLLEGVHFDLSYVPLHHLGYKTAVVNFSDIAAMNGLPKQMTISLGLSNRFSVEAIDALYQGVNAACKNYKVDLVGGDTSASPSGLLINVAVLGSAPKANVALRSGAKSGDVICVTGDLGASYLGLQILEREKQVFLTNPEMQPKLEEHKYIVERQLKPEARTDIVHELMEREVIPTAMIDISDGLASDLMHICHQSKVGARIYEDQLPIDQKTYETAVEFKIDPITCVLNGGEDYELLFTVREEDRKKLKDHPDIHFIGVMDDADEKPILITKNENATPLRAQGWEHFQE